MKICRATELFSYRIVFSCVSTLGLEFICYAQIREREKESMERERVHGERERF